MTPLEDVEADLREAQMLLNDPMGKLSARLLGLPESGGAKRVFLVVFGDSRFFPTNGRRGGEEAPYGGEQV